MSAISPFTNAHRQYVKSLYRRTLKNKLDWTIRRDIWRPQALQIRAEFEKHRNVTDPRALAQLFERAEAKLEAYYKDINPSTLTGAIDVIVIERPAPDGNGTELACSPFHVRFGKWQVLRPAEKKVNVSVNGNPIPYNMKIGDAGEAFFVFETEDDVPEDLITSPILQPTTPSADDTAAAAGAEASEKDARFGATDEGGDKRPEGEKSEEEKAEEEERILEKHQEQQVDEPEYLDLDGRPQPTHDEAAPIANHPTPKQSHHVPSFLKKSSSRVTLNQSSYLDKPERTESGSGGGDRTPEMLAQDQKVDAALQALTSSGHLPEVEYHKDVALDMEGYHSGFHDRERSDQTVRFSDFDNFQLPPSRLPLGLPGETQSSPLTPADPDSFTDAEDASNSPVPFPMYRATSEPPPDIDVEPLTPVPGSGHSTSDLLPHHQNRAPTRLQVMHQHQQEYMWEWGNFPQPSPIKPTFSKSGRVESPTFLKSGSGDRWRPKSKTVHVRKGRLGGFRLPVLDDSDEEEEDGSRSADEEESRGRTLLDTDHGRSHSVPPHLQGAEPTLHKKTDRRRWKEYEDSREEDDIETSRRSRRSKEEGGRINVSKNDPTKFILSIEGQRVGFQLSLAGTFRLNEDTFQQHLVEFERFLDDESVVSSPDLVVRWVGGDHFITRADCPPLVDSLLHWRDAALQRKAAGKPLRPLSPSSDDSSPTSPISENSPSPTSMTPEKPSLTHMRAKSEPPEQAFQEEEEAPIAGDAGLPSGDAVTAAVENALVHEVQRPPPGADQTGAQPPPSKGTRYAKTLRLTSDQLKALNLQPGANTITFSLSATGAVAATARIFVWDHKDLVVVSDIDGTITKSDGLGHVFAMIGRDWTHLGVAKLYTDITRNGYKIMYLTSRAIGQADATRGYLKGIKQNNYQLPEGPVIMSPDRLMASLHREVVLRKPEVFKMACLRDIQRLFGEHAKYQFYAGFGNRITDALSYRSVNIPSARIFTIDSAGEVKMELLELAGYKSSVARYIHMTDLVDQMFPPIHRKWTPEYTDFNYWRAPVQEFPLPDLSPPSPALSARSDTSNQSALARLRNFSLGNRQSTLLANGQTAAGDRRDSKYEEEEAASDQPGYRNNDLRQMSSFERLSSTLGFMTTVNNLRRSASPESQGSSYYDSEDDDEATLSDGAVGRRRRRERRRSMTSMPGSLIDEEEDIHFSDEEGEHYDDEYDAEDGDHEGLESEEGEEEAFDDDLLAAGEMQKVPFL
ncbi:hypothetical protein EST38_g692 [Candolleomyces aberdarensis]|uniref:phosphatidate phosphatase n=1 Tax=Candolleomyces aberdarensis TaxID=2316362 RepID=A0A4Q2DWW0_9AGAR|nr:hypothetical protein EST38_g692 [Candolleomyces aberdarensis]